MFELELTKRLQHPHTHPEVDFGRSSTQPPNGTIAKKSAVCIFIYPYQQEFHLSLMLRNTYNGVHSNQVSLPGGKKDPKDTTLKETALRECMEEIGAQPTKTIGELNTIYIPPSNFYVTPFVGISDSTPSFQLDKREVKEHIQLPLKTLISLPVSQSPIQLTATKNIVVPSFVFQEHIIWGATAHILSSFRHVLNDLSTF